MERNEFFKRVSDGQIEKVYLFSGPEVYVRRQAEQKLKDKLLEPGTEMMNLNILVSPTTEQIIESANQFPFMSERRLVIVREFAMLGRETDKSKDKGEAKGKEKEGTDEADRLIRFLSDPPETTCLLFDAGDGFDKRKKLGKFLSEINGCVTFTPLEGEELQKWIRKTVKGLGAQITNDAGERLVFLSGRDLTALQAEIMKLTAYVGEGGTIRESEVDMLATRTSEAQVFEMIDALFDGKTEAAFAQTDRLLRSGESRLGILALVTRQFRQMLFAESMNSQRRNSAEIGKAIGINPYFLRKTLARSAKMGTRTLKACLERCIATDYDIKRGQLQEEAGFERMMLEMAQIARKKNGQ
ncbi:MAG: DNA polymerase III subunit delta [Clostridia bacterium]|nr:DNA polymerase III subunit delta [Clostridia bacterium]